MKTHLISTALVVATFVLSACGGGGGTPAAISTGAATGSSASNSASNTGSETANILLPGVTATGPLVIQGTVATGAALAGASISAKCAVGSGSTTSSANGNFNIEITNGVLPCALRASSADGKTILHSAIDGDGGGKAIANISILSELIVTQAHGQAAADLFNQFVSNKSKLSTASLSDAKTKVAQALSSIVDLNNVDPIKDALVAAVAGSGGNSLDKKLDALRDKLLAAELTMDDLSKLFIANAGGSISEVIKIAVQPQSLVCKGLRSGAYRYIEPTGTQQVKSMTFDATTLTSSLEQYGGPNCYISGASGSKAAFGAQSIGIGITPSNQVAVILPKQSLLLSELGGSWNYVQRAKVAGTNNYKVTWGEISVSSDGKASAERSCDAGGCTTISGANLTSFTLGSDGEFVAKDGMRAFGYRAASGAMTMIGIDKINGDTGRLFVARKGRVAQLPTLADSLYNFDIGIDSNSQISSIINLNVYSINSISTFNNTFERYRLGDCQLETLSLGKPLSQMTERVAGFSPDCSGLGVIALGDSRMLASAGLGFTAHVSSLTNYLGLTVTRD
jgi:hypothetical protein